MQHAARFNSASGFEPAQDGDERGGFGCGVEWHESPMARELFADLSEPGQGSLGAVGRIGLAVSMLQTLRVPARQVGRADEMHCRQLAQSLQGTGDVTRNQQPGKESSCVTRRELAGQGPTAAFKQPVQQLGAGKARELLQSVAEGIISHCTAFANQHTVIG